MNLNMFLCFLIVCRVANKCKYIIKNNIKIIFILFYIIIIVFACFHLIQQTLNKYYLINRCFIYFFNLYKIHTSGEIFCFYSIFFKKWPSCNLIFSQESAVT